VLREGALPVVIHRVELPSGGVHLRQEDGSRTQGHHVRDRSSARHLVFGVQVPELLLQRLGLGPHVGVQCSNRQKVILRRARRLLLAKTIQSIGTSTRSPSPPNCL
jgi:hypothetical protein